MKKVNIKEHSSYRVFKKYILYMFSEGVGDFILSKHKDRKSHKNEISFLNKYRADILILMHEKNIPTHWFQTFFKSFHTGEMDLPLHEGISLSVGNYQINSENFDEEKVRQSGASSVSINITSKASATQLRQFMTDNSKLLYKLEELLGLPKVSYPRLDNFEQGFDLYLKKDFEKLSYGKILETIGKKKDESTLIPLKQTIKRYRKYFQEK